jgi:hypothetical protein
MQIKTRQQRESELFHLLFHDLANQVTAISLQCSMLQSQPMEAHEIEQRIERLYFSSQRMRSLIIDFRKRLSRK